MSLPYLPQDTIDEASEALRHGQSIESLAGKLNCSPEHLARLLGLPALRPVPKDDDCDLWAAEALHAVL